MKVTLEFPDDGDWTDRMARAAANVDRLSGRLAYLAQAQSFDEALAKTNELLRQTDVRLADLGVRIDGLMKAEVSRRLRKMGISAAVLDALLTHVPLSELRRLAD